MIVAGEIIKIHTYLFAAPRLRFMAGGSLLLEIYSTSLIPALARKLDPGCTVHLNAAGRFMVEFTDKQKAEDFRRMARTAGTCLFGEENTLVCGPFPKDGHGGGKSIIDIVADTLEGMKQGGAEKPYSAISGLQYMERCSACGNWGTPESRSIKGEPPVYLCRGCALKLDARNRRMIDIPLPESLSANGIKSIKIVDEKIVDEKMENSLIVAYPENKYNEKLESFQTIAQKSSPPYIGIFYADGNEMGELIHGNKSVEAYSEASEKIRRENETALDTAIEKVSEADGFPGLILIKGGDDLLAVLPADKSLAFARVFLEEASKTGSAFEKGICGGLVLTRPGIPFSILYEKADELLTNAKRQVWQLKKDSSNEISGPAEMSAIDFMLVSTPMIEHLERKAERRIYQMEANQQEYAMFTARPYILEEYTRLIKNIRKLKEMQVPRRLFMDLKDIFHPPFASEMKIEEARVDRVGEFIALRELINRLCTLYGKEEKEIEDFFDSNILNGKYSRWKNPDNNGKERDAIRKWQADIIEIADFF